MPYVFLIIGDGNTRKSSTIRSLTGAPQKKVYQIATHNGNIGVFVQISSLQESRISPQTFIQEVNKNGYPKVLVSLWISPGNGQPDGITYIQNFINTGWKLQEVVVLGTNNLPNLPPSTPNPKFVPNSRNLPANQIASQIRQQWQWM